jgi:hypothetical protein
LNFAVRDWIWWQCWEKGSREPALRNHRPDHCDDIGTKPVASTTGGFEAASFNQTPPFENINLFGNRTEDLPMARLYREASLNAIWEGSGNVVALEVLRVLRRNREAAHAVVDNLAGVCGAPGKAAALGIKKFLL